MNHSLSTPQPSLHAESAPLPPVEPSRPVERLPVEARWIVARSLSNDESDSLIAERLSESGVADDDLPRRADVDAYIGTAEFIELYETLSPEMRVVDPPPHYDSATPDMQRCFHAIVLLDRRLAVGDDLLEAYMRADDQAERRTCTVRALRRDLDRAETAAALAATAHTVTDSVRKVTDSDGIRQDSAAFHADDEDSAALVVALRRQLAVAEDEATYWTGKRSRIVKHPGFMTSATTLRAASMLLKLIAKYATDCEALGHRRATAAQRPQMPAKPTASVAPATMAPTVGQKPPPPPMERALTNIGAMAGLSPAELRTPLSPVEAAQAQALLQLMGHSRPAGVNTITASAQPGSAATPGNPSGLPFGGRRPAGI